MPDIKPDRHNWRKFCNEPELTEEENVMWNKMAEAITEAEAQGETELFNFILNATDKEFEDVLCVERVSRSDDWSDLVAWADAGRRLKRAKLAAWQEYLERREQ